MSNKRIWELDALRGLCILGMVAVHAVFDATELFGLISWDYPPAFVLVKNWGGVAFLLLSGICATIGSRSVRRGLVVLGCGMLITAVTAAGWQLGLVDGELVISFGVLHCLGVCMVLWRCFRRLSDRSLLLWGIALAAAGIPAGRMQVGTAWLIPFGLLPRGFVSADFFPLIPNLGFFLLGAALGRRLYGEKVSLFPKISADGPVLSFLQACGRHSLTVYLLHQPVLLAVLACF